MGSNLGKPVIGTKAEKNAGFLQMVIVERLGVIGVVMKGVGMMMVMKVMEMVVMVMEVVAMVLRLREVMQYGASDWWGQSEEGASQRAAAIWEGMRAMEVMAVDLEQAHGLEVAKAPELEESQFGEAFALGR
ncbi:MAG: hypothetical protein N2515_04850 [Deltaproteobacteria bacterium]|nr:hypothetical protein [Deltaproteobacteria bacterium]